MPAGHPAQRAAAPRAVNRHTGSCSPQVLGAVNFYVNAVTILNCDNGLFFSYADRSTIQRAPGLGAAHGWLALPWVAWQQAGLWGACPTPRASPPPWPPLPHPRPLTSPPSASAGVRVDVTAPRWAPAAFSAAVNGHHPISVTENHANLIQGFAIAAK